MHPALRHAHPSTVHPRPRPRPHPTTQSTTTTTIKRWATGVLSLTTQEDVILSSPSPEGSSETASLIKIFDESGFFHRPAAPAAAAPAAATADDSRA